MNKIHVLKIDRYDGFLNNTVFFLGPEKTDKEFKEFCSSFMEEAAKITLQRKRAKVKERGYHLFSRVTTASCLEALCELICQNGYDKVELPKAEFFDLNCAMRREAKHCDFSEELKKEIKTFNDESRYENDKQALLLSEIFEDSKATEIYKKSIREYEEKGYYDR